MTSPAIVTIPIRRLSDFPMAEAVVALVYGATGVGKTYFTATCGDRTLHLDLEKRRSTIQAPAVQQKYKYNPIYYDFSEEHLPNVAQALDAVTKILYDSYDYRDQFDVIVVDGVTALRRFGTNKALELNLGTAKSKTLEKMQAIKIADPITKKDRIVPNELGFVNMEMNDFTAEMQLTGKFLQGLTDYCRENGKHCVVTAHRRLTFEEKKKPTDADVIKTISPGFTGKTFPDEVIGLFDLIWYFDTIGTGDIIEYRATTVGSSNLIAKTCFPGVFSQYISSAGPQKKDDLNFQKIVQRIRDAGFKREEKK